MTTSRIDIFKQMLESDPANTSILFGLAKEYEKADATAEVIETLNRYLAAADDQGNAYGMLARAYEKAGRRDEAKAAYQRGMEVAGKHGHVALQDDRARVVLVRREVDGATRDLRAAREDRLVDAVPVHAASAERREQRRVGWCPCARC